MNQKEKALGHVRKACNLRSRISGGSNDIHLEHWLRTIADYIDDMELEIPLIENMTLNRYGEFFPFSEAVAYKLYESSENQSSEFYEMYCKTVGI